MITSTKEITVVDNFLPEYDFIQLEKFIFSNRITWTYGSKVTHDGDNLGNYQLCHHFVDTNDPTRVSEHANNLNIFMTKLGVQAIFRIKANLEGWKDKAYYSGFHVDNGDEVTLARTDKGFEDKKVKDMTTGIFYANTCNGYTEFEDGTIVNSVANRFVSFPASIKHRGVSQTNTKARIVINFNYWT